MRFRYIRCLLVNAALVVCPSIQASEETLFHETDAAHSDRSLRIPEPMVYDLVRPLGVKKGDLEINALVDINQQTSDASWAPEIEYGLADDLAFELELPFENASHERYKLAIQKTLGVYNHLGMANGWQAFVDLNKHTKTLSVDATYIHAIKWADNWSSLSMLGLRIHSINRSADIEYLINNTVFYDVSRRLTLGLELNQEVSTGGTWRYRVTPQLHYDIDQHYTVQAGAAHSTLNSIGKAEKLWSFRVIRVF
ncbi:MAG: hypothetical protein ACAH08_06340 [Methylophilus sp.]